MRRPKLILRRLAVTLARWALSLLSKPYVVTAQKTVVFAPHQDDETMGCGGLIARKRQCGFPVEVVFITDGGGSHPHHPQFTRADISAMREREAREALRTLGVEPGAIHFLNESDGTLAQLTPPHRAQLIGKISRLLGALRPDEIFLPCCPDGSSEHDATFGFVLEAMREAQVRPLVWQYPIWLWWNPLLLFKRIVKPGHRVRFRTGDRPSTKHRALASYRSQTQPLAPHAEPAVPPELIAVFDSASEYFFRFELPPDERPTSAGQAVALDETPPHR